MKTKLIKEILEDIKKYYPDAETVHLHGDNPYIIFSKIENCCRCLYINDYQSIVKGVKRPLKYSYLLIEDSTNRGFNDLKLITNNKEEILDVIKAISKCSLFFKRIKDKELLITKEDLYNKKEEK